jgi:hypothetical protein
MRLLGYEVPERFRYPLLAASPVDFWRRWNTYTGGWARRYIFIPVSLWLRHEFRSAPTVSLKAAAVMLTFIGIGAAHDLSVILRTRELGAPGGMLVFALHGIVLLVWVGLGRVLSATGRRATSDRSFRSSDALRWLAFSHVLILTMWLAIPGMSGAGLAEPLGELTQLLGLQR